MDAAKREESELALGDLGLNFEGLLDVVRWADGQRALCTGNDPRGFDLIVNNARAARRLREVFCGEDWQFDETDNQAGIRNPRTMVRVIHCNLDAYCGNLAGEPTNLSPKGSASRSKTRDNKTAWLPGLPKPPAKTRDGYTTWILGTHFDPDREELRAELSRPQQFSGNQFTRFNPRLILLDGSEGQGVAGRPQPVREGPTETVEIDVKRK